MRSKTKNREIDANGKKKAPNAVVIRSFRKLFDEIRDCILNVHQIEIKVFASGLECAFCHINLVSTPSVRHLEFSRIEVLNNLVMHTVT